MRYDFAVFGATGLQGRIVAKDLFANRYSVLLCGRDKSRVEDLLKKHKGKTGFEFIYSIADCNVSTLSINTFQ